MTTCSWCGELPSDSITLMWAQDRWQCTDTGPCRERCIARVNKNKPPMVLPPDPPPAEDGDLS